MSDCVLVLSTVDSLEAAKHLSRILVEMKLAACVNIISGVNSIYEWDGKIVEDGEFLLLIKTKSSLYKKLEDKVKEIHPYEEPEIICIDIDKGSESYLSWVRNRTL